MLVIWDAMELIMTSPKWQPNSLRIFFTLFYNKKSSHIPWNTTHISVSRSLIDYRVVHIGSDNGLVQSCNGTLTEPVMTKICNVICRWHYTAKSYTHMRNKNPICMHTKNIFQENAHGPRFHHGLQDSDEISGEEHFLIKCLDWGKLSTKCYSMCFSLPMTHWGLDKIEEILQMTFSTGFLNENFLILNKISWKYVP